MLSAGPTPLLLLLLARCWELLFNVCEVMQDINHVLEDQLQQQMRMECAGSGPPLPQDSFTRFVMEK